MILSPVTDTAINTRATFLLAFLNTDTIRIKGDASTVQEINHAKAKARNELAVILLEQFLDA